ncbi:hypothetical protein B0H21DRAFT_827162 [Amylocystis lapponica]|nr:hypothetical protein B0H21DRAFT_827162 [Amylocystis lapponica]
MPVPHILRKWGVQTLKTLGLERVGVVQELQEGLQSAREREQGLQDKLEMAREREEVLLVWLQRAKAREHNLQVQLQRAREREVVQDERLENLLRWCVETCEGERERRLGDERELFDELAQAERHADELQAQLYEIVGHPDPRTEMERILLTN